MSGKRQARPNPPEEWIIHDVPSLRIVGDQLWNEVKARQRHIRQALTQDNRGILRNAPVAPSICYRTLLRCGVCDAGFSKL